MMSEMGSLTSDVDGKLECHECGRAYFSLANHVRQAHGYAVPDYKERFGLNRTTPLISEHMRRACSETVARLRREGRWWPGLSKDWLDAIRPLVSHEKRLQDRIAIGRTEFHGKRNRPKLTTAHVREIRSALATGEIARTIAQRYGVSRGLVAQIKVGIAWRDDVDHSWQERQARRATSHNVQGE